MALGNQPNDPDHRRADDVRYGTDALPPGSVHPFCSAWESCAKCCYGNLTLADDRPERAELQFSVAWDWNRDTGV